MVSVCTVYSVCSTSSYSSRQKSRSEGVHFESCNFCSTILASALNVISLAFCPTTVRCARELHSAREDKMACTDTAKDVNNALHQCGDADAKMITLQYAAYMN